ncbi:helix-turn-helix domain-containing protein [Paraburkholderia aspalathi]|uniref:helix-turn-helix domain-containing protein n=1 Tax=Paraburkholderia aspalathi TaxID=1324617 RepID=UPI001B210169|nr:helix-turn-helix domain-containing protein [Paraburkholderia aspalathi]CAE6827063.1 hypothetical protein R20943_06453 [Paraburkholderia aspalathi]
MRCKFEGEMTLDAQQYAQLNRTSGVGSLTGSIAENDVLRIAIQAVQLYADRHPRPVQVTITQAAEMLGLSRHSVSKMVRVGQFKLNRCGLIPIEQVDAALRVR